MISRKLFTLCLLIIGSSSIHAQSLDLLVGTWQISSISISSIPANYKQDTTSTFKPGQATLEVKKSHKAIYKYKNGRRIHTDSIPKLFLDDKGRLSWPSNMVAMGRLSPENIFNYSPLKVVYQMRNNLALEYRMDDYPLMEITDEHTGKVSIGHGLVTTTYQIRMDRVE